MLIVYWFIIILNFSIRNDLFYGEGRVFINFWWEYLVLLLLLKVFIVVVDLN